MVDMEGNFNLQNCNDNDVLSFDPGTYKAGKVRQGFKEILRGAFAQTICDLLRQHGLQINPVLQRGAGGKFYRYDCKWFDEGMDCEILKIGAKDWQKGKFRLKVTLEFIPDEPEVEGRSANNEQKINEPESPLDDLRQMLNQENQH